jgi:two-component system nitrate/nitrite response regulator NarL
VTAPSDALRVVIADDHRIFRDGLRGALEEAGIEVVGEASEGAEAVALTRELAPDVVVLDLQMPGVSGLEALRLLAHSPHAVQAVVLTVSAEDEDVIEALASGASGYLLKDMRVDRLAEGIRQAAEGHMVLSSGVTEALLERVRANGALDAEREQAAAEAAAAIDRPPLTAREEDVLRLIAQGADNVAIGQALSISPHTVKQYVTNIFEKLGVRSRVQAAVYAVRAGLV